LFVLGGVDLGSLRKALAVGEGIAIIDHHAREAGQRGHFGEAFGNVPRAEDEGVRHRQHGLDEDIQLAAANQPVVVGGVLSQVESEVLGLFRLNHLPGRGPDFGLHAAAANRARHGPVLANQKLGALVTGNGPAHRDDGRKRALLPQIPQTHQFLVDVHSMTIISWRTGLCLVVGQTIACVVCQATHTWPSLTGHERRGPVPRYYYTGSSFMNSKRVVIIGGGIVGLATAYRLTERFPDARVCVLEKEAGVGRHQTGHNSGVLHCGLYYKPGSVKARLAVTGIRQMVEFCCENAVPHEICGKLVVAVDEAEVTRLRALHERGIANGLEGLRWMTRDEMREIEPHVGGVAALRVPQEGIVDYSKVCDALVARLTERGA